MTVRITSGTGTAAANLHGPTLLIAVNGVGMFSGLSIDSVGSGYVLTIGFSGLTVSTLPLSIVPGPAAALRVSGQPSATAGTALTPQVTVAVIDSVGNRVPTDTTAITMSIEAATGAPEARLRGTTTQTASGGLASFPDLSIDLAAYGYVLKASAPGLGPGFSLPFTIGLGAATALSSGSAHTCIVAVGIGYCWGDNSAGQLGNGSLVSTDVPVPVAGGLRFTSVSAGGSHSCGITISGAAYCWGGNSRGQLGNLTLTSSATPVAVAGGLTFTSVSAGTLSTCAVAAGGAAYCWGDNSRGQLGGGGGSAVPSLSPVAVAGSLTFSAIHTMAAEACGLTSAGLAYCWGDNPVDNGRTETDVPVPVPGGFRFASISEGSTSQPNCGVTNASEARCWGANLHYVLRGEEDTSSVPVPVTGIPMVAAVSSGGFQACTLTTAGAAYCWGDNGFGALGDGLQVKSSATPVAVAGGHTFAAISSGQMHVCGLTTAGAVYCWGYNGSGQLGTPMAANSNYPVPTPQRVQLF